jgi:hypothetical protein
MRPTGCPETSVRNYRCSLSNSPEECSFLYFCQMIRTIRTDRMAVVVGCRFVLSKREHIRCGGVNLPINIAIVWNVAPCSMVEIHRCFGKMRCPVSGCNNEALTDWIWRQHYTRHHGVTFPKIVTALTSLQSRKHYKLLELDIFYRWLVLLVTVFLYMICAVFRSILVHRTCLLSGSITLLQGPAVWSVGVMLLFEVGSECTSVVT